jgi:hypothetical protein
VAVTLSTEGWTLTLPDGWVELDVQPGSSRESTRNLIDQAAAKVPEVARSRAQWESLLQRSIGYLQDESIDRCACWVEPVSEHMVIEASIVVTARRVTEGNDFRQITAAFASSGGVEVVDLPAAKAVRAISHEEKRIQLPDGSSVALNNHVRQWFVPIPNSPDAVLVMSFATPTTAMVDDLALLFDDIAESLRINP